MRKALLSLIAFGTAAAPAAFAQAARPFAAPQAAQAPPPAGVSGLAEVALALATVLTAIFALAWLMRRMRRFGRGGDAPLDVLGEVHLGSKERAVLVRVGATQLLIGVAPGRVNTLHVLSEPLEIHTPSEVSATGRPSFRALLQRSLGRA